MYNEVGVKRLIVFKNLHNLLFQLWKKRLTILYIFWHVSFATFLHIVHIVIIMIRGYLKNEYVLFDTLGDINVLSFNKWYIVE